MLQLHLSDRQFYCLLKCVLYQRLDCTFSCVMNWWMNIQIIVTWLFNTLRLRQNGCHFPYDIFKWIFVNENVWISIEISLKFVPRGPINNILVLVQMMACCWPDVKPLSEPAMVQLLTHICITLPQWVNFLLCTHMILSFQKYLNFISPDYCINFEPYSTVSRFIYLGESFLF